LRAKFARAVTVRQHHRVPGVEQLLDPVAVARQHRFGMAAQAAAGMQCDHGGKRTIAVRLEELGVQGEVGRWDFDLMRSGQ